MSEVPSDPETFFTSYLRERFEAHREQIGSLTSVGSLTFRVPEVGEWSLRLREGELEIVHEMEDDVMLQITVPKADFAVLVSESLERAGAGAGAGARLPQTSGAPLRALAAKPDVARMVRHVPGSVLFVAKDGDLRRLLLVTPGHRKADLASAECTIECKMADMVDAQEKGLPPMQLFTQGKLKMTGNIQIAMALAAVLAYDVTRAVWLAVITLSAPLTVGCFRVAAVDSTLPAGRREALWDHSFLFGLAGETEIDVRRHCPGPAARVETGETLVTLGVTVLTLGVYTPRRTTITCAEPAARPRSAP